MNITQQIRDIFKNEIILYYPECLKWYDKKVVPKLYSTQSERVILCEFINNDLAAFCILKNTKDEKKISTLYVKEKYRKQNLGRHLLLQAFRTLKTSKPRITVSEDNLIVFQKLFNEYHFRLTSVEDNMYVEGKKEYIFN